MGCIYKIVNNINGKIYIGQTRISESQRWQQHVWHANNESNDDSLLLCRAIKKYGKENFTRSILEQCNNDLLNEREEYWIAYYDATNRSVGYNIALGGEGHSKYTDDEILQYYNKYGSITKASQALGMSRGQMTKRLTAMQIDTTHEVPVNQYDLLGNLIQKFSTIAEAAKTTNTPIRFIREQMVYNDYLWLRANNNQTPQERLQQLDGSGVNTWQIEQYNEYGVCVAKFANAAEAARTTGIDVSSIKAVSNGHQISAGGYLWVRPQSNITFTQILNKYLLSSSCCQIEEMDDNGHVLHTFKSCNEAEKFYGYGGNSIKPVCDGKRKATRGKHFRWKNPLKRQLLGLN